MVTKIILLIAVNVLIITIFSRIAMWLDRACIKNIWRKTSMIRLVVDDYCENCNEFEPDVEKMNCENIYGTEFTDTMITCVHKQRCKCIKNYLENK